MEEKQAFLVPGIMGSLCSRLGSRAWPWPQRMAQPARSPHPCPLSGSVFSGTCPTLGRPYLLASCDTICISALVPLITCRETGAHGSLGSGGRPLPALLLEEDLLPMQAPEAWDCQS